jgi:hypothetical protein
MNQWYLQCILLFCMISTWFSICADFNIRNGKVINENNGPLIFDTNGNGNPNITMSANGKLGIGVSIPASTLDIQGTIGFNLESISGNKTLSGNSIVVADSSSGNITLTLPLADDINGRMYTIKNISTTNQMKVQTISGLDKIDNMYQIILQSDGNTLPYLSLISASGNWHVKSISSNSRFQNVVASDNLKGWWSFKETSGSTASDGSDKGNDGTITNVAAGNIGVTGRIGKAIDFDGVNDYVTIADSTSLRPNQNYSIAMWVYPKTVASTYTHIAAKKGPGAPISYGLWLNNTDRFYFEVNDNSVHGVTGTTVLSVNTWYHVVATYDGVDLKIYVNGVLDATANSPGIVIDYAANPLTIGDGPYNAKFHGLIDEVTIYDYPLNLTQVQDLYNQ